MKSAYLLIDFFTIIVPFIFSFHPKLMFYRTWKAFFPAVLATGFIFIVFDSYFTHLGVWGFNPEYTIGFKVFNLPIEELLFFLCIPYSCVFTYHCLTLLLRLQIPKTIADMITATFIVGGIVAGIVYLNHLYTTFTFFSLAALLILSRLILKIDWLGKFYLVYLILLIPFCIVNGLLTGTGLDAPIVWYNSQEIIGFRILTIPFEDIFYGMNLILMNLLIYKRSKVSK